jgi:hypothetical protein
MKKILSIRSFKFTLNVQTKQNDTKIYSLAVARLPGEIQPDRCSIKVFTKNKIKFFEKLIILFCSINVVAVGSH